MGTLFQFRCPRCGYEAQVSGGLGWGILAVTHTVSCPTCTELSDMIVAEEPWEFSEWMERECVDRDDADAKAAQAPWMPEKIRCDLHHRHKASLWSHPGPCPRCGTTLAKGEMTVLWD